MYTPLTGDGTVDVLPNGGTHVGTTLLGIPGRWGATLLDVPRYVGIMVLR